MLATATYARAALRNAIREIQDGQRTPLIGAGPLVAPAQDVVLDLDRDEPIVIHAMALRPKFLRLL